ncbi:MAG TPA: bifunctional phosphoglucose/phosphomannose isomerase [Candidatus Saccharibacteria bacterium]|nr:bifunctional phosphoglucose/phosphomannose isomerase [Candidatus Saccharibacteria bacterium]
MDILDNPNVVAQRDPEHTTDVIAREWEQVALEQSIEQGPSDTPEITRLVVAGMGGSALAADMAKDWLELAIPFEVVKGYDLPAYVDSSTLVVASSFSGNTEETLSALAQAQEKGAHVVAIAKGGKLLDAAKAANLPYIQMVWEHQPRMGMFMNLNALIRLLVSYRVVAEERISELAVLAPWLEAETKQWVSEVPGESNLAKQLASWCAGKVPMIYSGSHIKSVAYKWKISFNENSKNVAFWNEIPEFNHNEFIGWASHPVEKPFAVIDLRSSFDHPRIVKRFETSDRLLSGLRPAAKTIELRGDSRLAQMLWGAILADFVSVYLGILNGVDPMKVELVERFKVELG